VRSTAAHVVAVDNLLSGSPAIEVPEGSWFTLPARFNPATWAAANHSAFTVTGSLSAQQMVQMVCTAIQTYGLVIVDTAGNLAFGCENGQTFGLSNGSPRIRRSRDQWHLGIRTRLHRCPTGATSARTSRGHRWSKSPRSVRGPWSSGS
jgi:hypothetical protein